MTGLALLLLLCASVALGAGVSGTVTDAGRQRAFSAVSITLDGEGVLRDATSGADGRYVFADLPPGRYRLEFVSFDYPRLSRDIELGADQQLVLDVVLVLDAFEIEDVRGRGPGH